MVKKLSRGVFRSMQMPGQRKKVKRCINYEEISDKEYIGL